MYSNSSVNTILWHARRKRCLKKKSLEKDIVLSDKNNYTELISLYAQS